MSAITRFSDPLLSLIIEHSLFLEDDTKPLFRLFQLKAVCKNWNLATKNLAIRCRVIQHDPDLSTAFLRRLSTTDIPRDVLSVAWNRLFNKHLMDCTKVLLWDIRSILRRDNPPSSPIGSFFEWFETLHPAERELITSCEFINQNLPHETRVQIVRLLPQMQKLSFDESGIDDSNKLHSNALASLLDACPRLEELSLKNAEKLEDLREVQIAKRAPRLRSLELEDCHEIHHVFESLLPIASQLASCLFRGSCRENSAFLAQFLKAATSLTRLELPSSFHAEEATLISFIQSHSDLESLSLDNQVEVSDKTLETVASCSSKLREFRVSFAPISDVGVKALVRRCKQLQSVSLKGISGITEEVFRAFSEAHIPRSRVKISLCSQVNS
jgi:hypothetical protein